MQPSLDGTRISANPETSWFLLSGTGWGIHGQPAFPVFHRTAGFSDWIVFYAVTSCRLPQAPETDANGSNGMLILGTTCAPHNIPFHRILIFWTRHRKTWKGSPMTSAEDLITSFRRYTAEIPEKCMDLARYKERTVKKIRSLIKPQFQYIRRDKNALTLLWIPDADWRKSRLDKTEKCTIALSAIVIKVDRISAFIVRYRFFKVQAAWIHADIDTKKLKNLACC